MAVLSQDQASAYDVVINGVGYTLDSEQESPFQVQAPDDALEKTSIDPQLEQNTLDTLYWGKNRSWHEGQGQTRLDVPPRFQIDPTTASSPYKHLRSKGVDITTRGQLTLLHRTLRYRPNANQDPNPQKLASTDQYMYAAGSGSSVWRWSALDGSDATTIGDGSAGTACVLDFASDGGFIYAALGAEGISRLAISTSAQINAADALTGWAGTNATLTLDAVNKKEGTNAIQMAVANGVTGTATLTIAANYSAKDQFSLWLNAPTSVTNMELRFITSGGNYFTTVVPGYGGYANFFLSRTGSFGSVGAPNWASIASIALVWTNATGGTVNILVDDLEAIVGGAFTLWETSMDARVIGWANDQLYAAGIKTGTQWRFFKAAAAAASVETYVLPDGWTVTSIRALGGLIYFSAYRGNRGAVYVYDGVNAPTVACPPEALGIGTIPLSLIPFAGAGMLIGCRRLTTTGSTAGLGVLYRGFPDAAGALRLERLQIHGADDGRDYGIRCGIAYGDFTYYGWNYGDEPANENFLVGQTKRSGLGVYWPETGGWGRSYLTDPGANYSGIVEDVAIFKGRRMFSVGGYGVFTEQTTYEAEGGVQSSLIDVNVSADKIWLAEESYYSNPEGILSPVSHAYSLDGTTWLNDTLANNAATIRLRTSFNALGLKTPSIFARTRLLTTSGTVTPILYQTGIGGYPATKPLPTYVLSLRAYPSTEMLDGSRTHQMGDGWAALNRLLTLWRNQTIVDFQPPWAFSDPANPTSERVRVSDVQADKGWNSLGSATGGVISIKLKVVP